MVYNSYMRTAQFLISITLLLCSAIDVSAAKPATKSKPAIEVREYDIAPFLVGAREESAPDPTLVPRRPDDVIGGEYPTRREVVERLISLITETVDRDSWRDNGGDYGEVREEHGKIVVTQTKENHRYVKSLLGQLKEKPSTRAVAVPEPSEKDDESVTRVYDIRDVRAGRCVDLKPGETVTREAAIEALKRKIVESVAPQTWHDNGGDQGAIREAGGSLIITQRGSEQRAIKELLEELRQVPERL
jgi:hypothetical protein